MKRNFFQLRYATFEVFHHRQCVVILGFQFGDALVQGLSLIHISTSPLPRTYSAASFLLAAGTVTRKTSFPSSRYTL